MTYGLNKPLCSVILAQHSNFCFGSHFQPFFDNTSDGLQSLEMQVWDKD